MGIQPMVDSIGMLGNEGQLGGLGAMTGRAEEESGQLYNAQVTAGVRKADARVVA